MLEIKSVYYKISYFLSMAPTWKSASQSTVQRCTTKARF